MKEILDPASEYRTELQAIHKQKMEDYFDGLVKESGVDVKANRKTISDIDREERKLSKTSRTKSGYVALQVILSIISAVSLLVIINLSYILGYVRLKNEDPDGSIFEWFLSLPLWASILIIIAIAIFAGGIIAIQATVVRKTINNYSSKESDSRKKIEQLESKAKKQMESFNSLYDWKEPLKLWNETVEIVNLDTYFDINKYMYMKKKYKLQDLLPNESTLFVQSGSIVGNPFFFYKKMRQDWFDKTYTGTLVVQYEKSIYDPISKDWISRTVTQTLTAYSYHPAPEYNEHSELIYANDAAPNLTFSRQSSGTMYDLKNKHIIHTLDKKVKDLDKYTAKEIKKGKKFNAIQGDYFEAMFNCTDRNNENEYRLLFSPLARRSMINIMSSPDGYGDDFGFKKMKCLNFIDSKHLTDEDIALGDNYYYSDSFDSAKEMFFDFNENYFKSMFFALAPILSIPLYQQYKPREEIYKDTYKMIASPLQYESLANHYSQSEFAHPKSITKNIIKTDVISHDGNTDIVNVIANGFKGIPRIDYVPQVAGDGMTYNVPVHWTEYIAVQETTPIVVNKETEMKLDQFNKVKVNSKWQAFLNNFKGNSSTTKYNRDLISTISSKGALDAKTISKAFKGITKKEK